MKNRNQQQKNFKSTHQLLVDSARILFVEKGYQTVSIDEISAKALVTKGAFYHHFKNKKQLLCACYKQQLTIIDNYITTNVDLMDSWSALERVFECYLDYIIANNHTLIPIQEVMPVIGWNELEKINLEYTSGRVNAIIGELIQQHQLKDYSDDVLKNLLNGWFMHIAIHAKNIKQIAEQKNQFITIYRDFLLSLKKIT
ncbi:TetR family transcriptional regulator [Providencia sp. 21OH12SH02B-Prov]|uniref:TetR family transcriptional regulator n=1 Tax=Providencia sp. 21OH12SH02B-Prov TaxID=3015951 RepID=UPI0022B62EB0|nr:TetR family transcriptional regulator [Providencia sp. 21OH12SH02B-Prov]WBA57995.1 TetR family transcriptional regulator [Providencia sp. 21OH12SH02B-Prov]